MSVYRIADNAEQGYEVQTDWGASISLGTTNPTDCTVNLPVIRSVGIDDLRKVLSHDINRIAQSTSHVVRFIMGGHVEFAYNDRGELLALRAESAHVNIDSQGCMIFGPYRAPQSGDSSTPN